MSLVPAETTGGMGLGVQTRHILGRLFWSHVWKKLTKSRWQRHHAQAANVLWNQARTEVTTNSIFPAWRSLGLIFQGICFFVLIFRVQPLWTAASPKKRSIPLVTTKKTDAKNLLSCRSSRTGRKKNYQITSESCVFTAANPQWFVLLHAGLLSSGIASCIDR